jgi:hypothetical protein
VFAYAVDFCHSLFRGPQVTSLPSIGCVVVTAVRFYLRSATSNLFARPGHRHEFQTLSRAAESATDRGGGGAARKNLRQRSLSRREH